MLDFKTNRKFSENTPAVPVTSAINAEIDRAVEIWVSELIKTLTGTGSVPQTAARPRGIWDRFKGTLSNLWHGRYDKNNPYKWINRFGDDLGVAEESFQIEKLSLNDYRLLKETCLELERQINEVDGVESLRLVRLIRSAADKLKNDLKTIMATAVSPNSNIVVPSVSSKEKTINNPIKSGTTPPSSKNNPVKSDSPSEYLNGGSWMQHKEFDDNPNQKSDLQPKDSNSDNKDFDKNITPKQKLDSPSEDSNGGGWTNHSEFDNEITPDNENFYITPPTNGKSWIDLTKNEIEKWNIYGGGIGTRITGRWCLNLIKNNPIDNIPWILRIGDPRIDVLKSQIKGTKEGESFVDKYLNTKIKNPPKCLKQYDEETSIYQSLMNMGRIETSFNPIKNEQDLKDRIKVIKNRKPKKAPVGNTMPSKSINAKKIDTAATAVSDMQQEPIDNPINNPKIDTTAASDMQQKPINNDITSPIVDSPKKHPTDDTSLSRPYEGKPKKLKMSGSQKREFNKKKEELDNIISNESFPKEYFVDYVTRIYQAKSLEDLEEIEKGIKAIDIDEFEDD